MNSLFWARRASGLRASGGRRTGPSPTLNPRPEVRGTLRSLPPFLQPLLLRPLLRSFWPALVIVAAAVGLGLGLGPNAQAHPHEWIDLRVRLIFDDDRRLTAMEQSWMFDPFFSAYVLDELTDQRPDRAAIAAKAEALGPEMVGNLAKHGFLNDWHFDGEPVTGLSGSFVGTRVTRDQLELTFRLDLDQPLELRGSRFEYSVFDPTYYIEILHARRHLPELRGAPRGCRREIIEPAPPEDLAAFAASLDQNAESDEGLGIHFAERAVIECRG